MTFDLVRLDQEYIHDHEYRANESDRLEDVHEKINDTLKQSHAMMINDLSRINKRTDELQIGIMILGRLAQLVERCIHIANVTGSSPVATTD